MSVIDSIVLFLKLNMMKKDLVILFFFMVMAIRAMAQDPNSYIGVKGGLSIPNLTAGGSSVNPVNSGYSSITGPDFAVFYENRLSKKFSIMPSLEYSTQGGKKNGYQAFPTPADIIQMYPAGIVPSYLYANFNSEAKLNYLMLDLLAKLNWQLGETSPLSFYVDAGPFASLLMSAHEITSGSSIIYADAQKQQALTTAQSFDSNLDIKDQLHKGNVGVEADLGFALSFANSQLFLEGGGNYGFLNIQKGSANGKNNIGAATVRIGYAYNF